MDVDDLWALIERGRAACGPNSEAVTEHLIAELAVGPEEEIFAFHTLQDSLEARAYDWLLWAAAYLIQGGCSDDSFIDFRASLVLQGREAFERVLQDPDSLADLPAVRTLAADPEGTCTDDLFFEDAGRIAPAAFRRRHGPAGADEDFWDALEARLPKNPARCPDPTGESFDFDDDEQMRRRLPRLAALFH